MSDYLIQIEALKKHQENASLHVSCLGRFEVYRGDHLITTKEWGRDKTVQLFQFLIASRHRNSLHKELIIDRLWEDAGMDEGNRDFKVAMHGINKVLEPDRKSRAEAKYIQRQGISYQLNKNDIWMDVEALDAFITIGNNSITEHIATSKLAFQHAVELYQGAFLPNRIYEDWSSAERERLQLLILNAYISYGELLLEENPAESIRLAQEALIIDHSWEEAYRLQMRAYLNKANQPMVIKTYRKCVEVLDEEFGIEPLPETKTLVNAAM